MRQRWGCHSTVIAASNSLPGLAHTLAYVVISLLHLLIPILVPSFALTLAAHISRDVLGINLSSGPPDSSYLLGVDNLYGFYSLISEFWHSQRIICVERADMRGSADQLPDE